MGVLNTDEPYDTVEDMVKVYCTPTNGLLPDTVRQWGAIIPHMIEWLTGRGRSVPQEGRRQLSAHARFRSAGESGGFSSATAST